MAIVRLEDGQKKAEVTIGPHDAVGLVALRYAFEFVGVKMRMSDVQELVKVMPKPVFQPKVDRNQQRVATGTKARHETAPGMAPGKGPESNEGQKQAEKPKSRPRALPLIGAERTLSVSIGEIAAAKGGADIGADFAS